MGHFKRLILLVLLCFLLPAGVYAGVDASSQSNSNNVFKFQQKLANKGHAHAQYKLATMYESGSGTKQDLEQAKYWYDKASSAGVKVADDRITYLVVKQQGYDKTKNSTWLAGIQKDARESKGEALFLLAQLYRQGLGVKKDLYRAREILDTVSLLGAADVENEMALIQQEIDAAKKAKNNARRKHQIELARLTKEKQHQVEQLSNINQSVVPLKEGNKLSNVEKSESLQATGQSAVQVEKLRRYNKAMLALKLEQQKIDEQQAWASGSDDEVADDEI